MVCYSIVLGAAILTHGLKSRMEKRVPHSGILLTLLWGGAIVLAIDHLLNGELFLISGNLAWDLVVGAMMTAAILAVWGLYAALTRWMNRPRGYGA